MYLKTLNLDVTTKDARRNEDGSYRLITSCRTREFSESEVLDALASYLYGQGELSTEQINEFYIEGIEVE